MSNFTIMNGSGVARCCRYKQGHGRRTCDHGPKMQAFKGLIKKGVAMGKKHLLPQMKKIGRSVLFDALEGCNIGESLKSHSKQAAFNSLKGTRRRRVHRC